MKPNLWLYSSSNEINSTAASMVAFGVEIFKRAKIVSEIDLLQQSFRSLRDEKSSTNHLIVSEFAFNYLIDSIKILIFFENYMKAELIINGFCVHQINKEFEKFKDLSKQQYKRPIGLKEIHDIEPFEINNTQKTIYHTAIKETTIGFKDLIGSIDYLKHYQFDEVILEDIKQLSVLRNKLHFNFLLEFTLSEELILKIKRLDEFAIKMVGRLRDIPLFRASA